MTDITPGWTNVFIGAEGSTISSDTLDPWSLEWHLIEEPAITVAHPNHSGQRHTMHIYELRQGDRTAKFAAGEYSNGVWGILVPAKHIAK